MQKLLSSIPRSLFRLNKQSFSQEYYYPEHIDLRSTIDSFKASDTVIEKTTTPLKRPPVDASIMKFGQFHTDHLLQIDWTEQEGWGKPFIGPFKPFQIHPFSSCLHYAIECFEGTKAFKNSKGELRWFRADANMYRMKKTATRLSLPDFDGEEFIQAQIKLIDLDRDWVPQVEGFAAYIRPTFIATEETLGVRAPTKAKLFSCVSPVGPYFPTGFKPVKVYANTSYVRAGPRGVGEFKVGGNYAPTIQPNKQSEKLGYNQTLWTLPNGLIQEMGVCNLFFVMKTKDGEIQFITPKLDGTVLPGVTRDAVIRIVDQIGKYKMIQRDLYITEVIEAFEQNRMLEVFGSGTAVNICPIQTIGIKDKQYHLKINEIKQAGDLTYEIYKILTNIQSGTEDHPWVRTF